MKRTSSSTSLGHVFETIVRKIIYKSLPNVRDTFYTYTREYPCINKRIVIYKRFSRSLYAASLSVFKKIAKFPKRRAPFEIRQSRRRTYEGTREHIRRRRPVGTFVSNDIATGPVGFPPFLFQSAFQRRRSLQATTPSRSAKQHVVAFSGTYQARV